MDVDSEKGTFPNNELKTEIVEVSKFRRALPQILATSAKNLILLDLGMTIAFPTLVIAALLNAKGEVTFDNNSASWFGSIVFICQPLGSIISGTVLEPLGRKKSMLMVNIPHLIGWYLFYSAISIPVLFTAAVLMGLGVGFMEAPVITYVGEISEPRLRGILTSYSGIFVTIGLIIEFLLGTLYGWNKAAFISSFIPIITIVAISQIPETPMWLLSKGRVQEAEKSLQWLRGWVPASNVQKELNELIRYSNASKLILKEKKSKSTNKNAPMAFTNEVSLNDEISNKSNVELTVANVDGTDDSTKYSNHANGNVIAQQENDKVVEKKKAIDDVTNETTTLRVTERKATIKELIMDTMRPQMLRPLSLVIAFFFFHNGSGFPAIRPYMVNVFEELRFPVDAHWATVIISTIGFLGVIVCTIFVKYVGKRFLTLASLVGCAISILSLSIWSLLNENSKDRSPCWSPFLFFILLSFSFSFGIAPIPWMILSEVFPFRGRGFASGVAAAISYLMGFVTSKTFLDLKSCLGLSGVFSLYGCITITGIVYVYYKLPETEGRSLEDIENLYKSEKKTKI